MDADRPHPVLQFRRRRAVGARRRRARCCRTRRSSTPPTAPASLTASSEAEIAERVPALLGRLVERFHPRLVVIACNTASTIALDHVRAALDLPVVGTVPAIKPAAEMSKTPRDRRARHRSDRPPALCRRSRRASSPPTARSSATARPSWSSWPRPSSRGEDDQHRRGHAPRRSRCSTQPGGERIDTVVLACTHFPLLERRTCAPPFPDVDLRRRRRRHRPAHRLSDPRAAVARRSRPTG